MGCHEEIAVFIAQPLRRGEGLGFWTARNYREAYGMFACTGILSNYDSPLGQAFW